MGYLEVPVGHPAIDKRTFFLTWGKTISALFAVDKKSWFLTEEALRMTGLNFENLFFEFRNEKRREKALLQNEVLFFFQNFSFRNELRSLTLGQNDSFDEVRSQGKESVHLVPIAMCTPHVTLEQVVWSV